MTVPGVAGSEIIDLDGPVHLADYGGEGQLVVLIHGLEGSHLNWLQVGSTFAEHYRVIAPDLAGFGLTPPAERGSGVDANAELVLELVRKYGDEPAILIGNSMGGLVSLIAAAEEPYLVDRLVLVDPALPPPNLLATDPEVLVKLAGPLIPFLGSRMIRTYQRTHSPEEHARESMMFVTANPDAVSAEQRAASQEMIRLRRQMDWAVPAMTEGVRSIGKYVLSRKRYHQLIHRVCSPTLIIHGSEDRLVLPEAAEWAVGERPDWDLQVWEDIGHVPMMEDPTRFTDEVLAWLPPAAV